MRKINNFYANNFDLARLVAAFLVLFTHGFELVADLKDEPLYALTNGKLRCSTIGLYIFFFTSGYLVTKSFIKTPRVGEFIWKRFLRIFPALIVIVFVTVFLIGPIFTKLPIAAYFTNSDTYRYLFTSTGIYIRHILPGVFEGSQHYDHGVNGSLWSISLELKLYFLLVCLGILFKKGIKNIFTYLALISFVLNIFVMLNLFNLQYYFTPLHFSLFVLFWIGSVCCIYYDRIILNSRILFFLVIPWIFCLYFFEPMRMIFELFFFSYLTLYCCYTRKTISLKIDLSYGTYIYAFLTTQIYVELLGKTDPLKIIFLVTWSVIMLSLASWLLIEKNSLAFKKYYDRIFISSFTRRKLNHGDT